MRDDPALYGVGPRGAWLALRALATLHQQKVARYVAAQDPGRGWHVLDLAAPAMPKRAYRQLRILPRYYTSPRRPTAGTFGTPGEAWWYALGMEDHIAHGVFLEAVAKERAPKLLTVADAAVELGISPGGVRALLESYALYPVYEVDATDHRTRRLVFAAQVVARRGGARNVQRWREIRALLPDLQRVDTIAEHVILPASPAVLPVDPAMPTPLRQREALAIGHTAGWYKVTGQQDERFTLALPDGRVRELPLRAVEPWLLGLADARGEGARVAYRDDLG